MGRHKSLGSCQTDALQRTRNIMNLRDIIEICNNRESFKLVLETNYYRESCICVHQPLASHLQVMNYT